MKQSFFIAELFVREKSTLGFSQDSKLGLLNFGQMFLPCEPALELEQRIDGIYL